MSYNLKYYPDPGIAFDISRMLFIKLNPPSVWQSALTTLDTQSDEIQYIENRAASLPAAPSELLLLSYLTPNRKSPLLSTIISKLIYEDFSSFSISILLDYFSNTKQIQKDIFTYYIGDHPLTSTDLERTIRLNKNIPNKLKLLLFGFMLNPISYITSFCDIIKTYYSIITEQWISDSSPEYIPSTFINYIIGKTYTADTHEISNLYTKTISYSLCFSSSAQR